MFLVVDAIFSNSNAKYESKGQSLSLPIIDLSVKPNGLPENIEYLYELSTVDKASDYFAHPDAIVLSDSSIMNYYPEGHGKGAIRSAISYDGGVTYQNSPYETPSSWQNSRETPTVYRLKFIENGSADKLILISGNPKWPGEDTTGGFNCSVSDDEGKTWSEFELFYSKEDKENGIGDTIVAMSTLVQLKENGNFVNKWMGLFHDIAFNNYKTILTFDENGKMQWSVPVKYFEQHKDIQYATQMCEVEVIRSDKGRGDELCLITRSNSKRYNSLISFSIDEGETWSEPKEVNANLNGERHKAEYTADDRLVISFRSIIRDEAVIKKYEKDDTVKYFRSYGPCAWVGTYQDLKNGNDGQYFIKLAHTYLSAQKEPALVANADTGYCGNVVLSDDTVVISTYGCFSADEFTADGSEYKTYIASKRFKLSDIDALSDFLEK